MPIIEHNPSDVFPPYRAYSHAIEISGGSRLLFISGLNGYKIDAGQTPWHAPPRIDGDLLSAARATLEARSRGHGRRMIRILDIDHLVLRVVNLDKMLHFYCDALGCTVERQQEAIGLVQLRAGRSLIDLVTVDGKLGSAGGAAPGTEGRNLDHFCLRVESFDEAAIRSQLARHGYAAGAVESRYGAEGEGPSIYLTDPEGNVVELKGPPDA
jgi:glyoxylase I family protein